MDHLSDGAIRHRHLTEDSLEYRNWQRARSRFKKALKLHPEYKIEGGTFNKIVPFNKSDLLIWILGQSERLGCKPDDLKFMRIHSLVDIGPPCIETLTAYCSLSNIDVLSPALTKARRRVAERIKGRNRQTGKCLRRTLRGTEPNKPLFNMLGYSSGELARHIERQFTQGMTWDAFLTGDIHIDHIIPLSSFDLSDEQEMRAAWALSNLRPLWAEDNGAKGQLGCTWSRGYGSLLGVEQQGREPQRPNFARFFIF